MEKRPFKRLTFLVDETIKDYFAAKLKSKKINKARNPALILGSLQKNLFEKAKGHGKQNYSDNIFLIIGLYNFCLSFTVISRIFFSK